MEPAGAATARKTAGKPFRTFISLACRYLGVWFGSVPRDCERKRKGKTKGNGRFQQKCSDHVDRGCRPLAAVGGAGVIGRASVHVRGLQLHLAGRNRRVQLHLRPVNNIEHQADADDDLQGRHGVE